MPGGVGVGGISGLWCWKRGLLGTQHRWVLAGVQFRDMLTCVKGGTLCSQCAFLDAL